MIRADGRRAVGGGGIGEAAGLHNPNYDFNDDAAPYGASFFARLVEKAQPVS